MKALICGAGIAGLSSAWWLDRLGWEVHVVEKAPALRDEGYMIDFFGAGYDAADLMGILGRLEREQYPVAEVVYVDERGRHKAGLSYALFRESQDGRLLALMRGSLERALHESLPDRVRLSFDTTVKDARAGDAGVDVVLERGGAERVDLLIGADGVHSRVRELLFAEAGEVLRFLGYHVASYFFEDAELQEALGDDFEMLSVPGREVGLYKVRGGQIAALFAHRADDARLPDDPASALRASYGDLGWHVPAVLARCPGPPSIYYDIVAQVELSRWYRDRVVLVGDACQAVSLLAGQGASMAMGGACLLASELAAHDDVGAALASYQERMKPAIAKKQAAGRKTARWFVPASATRIALRNVMIRIGQSRLFRWMLERPLAAQGESVIEPRDRERLAALAS